MNAIHAGIDVAFYGSDRQLEYELHVAPAGSPDRVAMAFDGADAVGLDASGDVVVSAAGRYLRMGRPAAYQKMNGALTPVAVEYVVRDHTARLVLGEYDRTRPLVIHPAP